MLVGFNYPWPANRYVTIGPNLTPRGRPQPWTQDKVMADNFGTLKEAGITVVRIWLMGDGANYDGKVKFDFDRKLGYVWDFQPPDHLDSSFIHDFDALLDVCGTAGMQIIPVLLDYQFFNEPRRDSRYAGSNINALVSLGYQQTKGDFIQGRRSIASNPSYREQFIKGSLQPLLDVAARKKEIIYAFEVMNEPWWCIAPLTSKRIFGRAMKKGDLLAFLSGCQNAIKEAALKSTIGHRYLHNIYGAFSNLTDDLPQHHYYADWLTGDHLMFKSLNPKPARILGEFASITPNDYKNLKWEYQKRIGDLTNEAGKEPDKNRQEQVYARAEVLKDQLSELRVQKKLWAKISRADNDPDRVVEMRLHIARERGYELSLIWPDAIDPDTPWIDSLKLSSKKLKSVKRFVSSQ